MFLVTAEYHDNQNTYQTGNSLYYKESSIIRLPGVMASGAPAFFVPLPCQSSALKTHYLKTTVNGSVSGE